MLNNFTGKKQNLDLQFLFFENLYCENALIFIRELYEGKVSNGKCVLSGYRLILPVNKKL